MLLFRCINSRPSWPSKIEWSSKKKSITRTHSFPVYSLTFGPFFNKISNKLQEWLVMIHNARVYSMMVDYDRVVPWSRNPIIEADGADYCRAKLDHDPTAAITSCCTRTRTEALKHRLEKSMIVYLFPWNVSSSSVERQMNSVPAVTLHVNWEKNVSRTEDCSRFKLGLKSGAPGRVMVQVNQPLFPAWDNYNSLPDWSKIR